MSRHDHRLIDLSQAAREGAEIFIRIAQVRDQNLRQNRTDCQQRSDDADQYDSPITETTGVSIFKTASEAV